VKTGLTQGLRRAVQMRPHATALIDGDRRFTWAELSARIGRLAGALHELGVGDGVRVALLATNSHRSFELYFAALQTGGIVTPLNHRLSEREIAAQIADAEPHVLVASLEFIAIAERLRAACPALLHIVAMDGAESEGVFGYETLLASAAPIEDAGRGGDDIACLFYTGGTTGNAKGVMLTHANILANSVNFIAHMGIDHTAVHLHCGPLFHVAAGVRLFSVTQVAGTHVILPRFVAADVLEAIETAGVTLATFAPTMLRALLDEPSFGRHDLSGLRYITYGAAPMPEMMLRELLQRMPDVRFVQSYGMTETSPIITMLGWRDHLPEAAARGQLRAAGRAAMLAEVAIVDAEDRPVPVRTRGEIVARGPMVMAGYWRRPEATAEALRGGWMHTGDVGFLDEDGYLFVVDRLKDMIITGGENVYSQEVEQTLLAHPAVSECAVFGRPDPRWGEAVHAVVVPKEVPWPTERDLIEHCKRLMAGYKCPRSIELRSEPLPLSGANKVLKVELRKALLAREAQAEARA